MLVNVCLRSCRNCKDVLPVFQRSTWFGCSSLSDNQFTGDFPSSITTLTKLTLLYVQATFSLGESLGHAAKTSRTILHSRNRWFRVGFQTLAAGRLWATILMAMRWR